MRQNLPITDTEETFQEDERLISTTNLRGVIQDANETFIKVSGFSAEELQGQPHNIVRHPDMPEAVYADFWATLQAGKPWMGLVKNRCKNGDYYWVNAYVSPIYQGGEQIGFQSVRTRPKDVHRNRAWTIYNRIKAGKTAASLSQRLGLGARLFAAGLVLLIGGGLGGYLSASGSPVALSAVVLGTVLGAIGCCYPLVGRLKRLDSECRAVFDNEVGALVYGDGRDTLAMAELALAMQRSQLAALRGRVEDLTSELTQAATDAREAAESGHEAADQQESEIQQVAAAMEEMSSTVEEVSSNTSKASELAADVAHQADSGRETILQTNQAMESLATNVSEANEAVQQLRDQVHSINSVVQVINGIAEQTNLLALNAAIEAARAGESGRGFAVVADEVRKLAHRVSESTKEIRDTIEALDASSDETVATMESSHQFAVSVQSQAQESSERIQNIESSIETIRSMADQIAAAAEQQSSTAADMTQRINQIHGSAETSEAISGKTRHNSDNLVDMVERLRGVVQQFRLRS